MIRKSIINSLYISLSATILASCNASEESFLPLADGTRAVTVGMQLGVSGGIASRELTMWDGAQQVNDMRIYVFRCPKEKFGTSEEAFTYYIPQDLKDDDNKSYYTVTGFDNRKPYYSYEHNNNPQQYSYEFKSYLPKGFYYQFLAVGRDDKYVSEAERSLNEVSFAEGTTLQDTKIELTSATINNAKLGTFRCTEFFSGHLRNEKTKQDMPILVDEGREHFNCTLTATRNVAGMMMYVTNIPTQVDDNTQDIASPVTFTPTRLSIEVTGLEGATMIDTKSVPGVANDLVSKNDGDKGYLTLGTIDLTPANGWAKDDTKKVFTRPADDVKGWLENSYMVSNFMLPTPVGYMGESKNFDKSKVTFMLHYSDDAGHHRYDNIKDKNTERILFPIETNHIYSLGIKTSNINKPFDLHQNNQPVMMDMTIELEPAFDKKHEFETE